MRNRIWSLCIGISVFWVIVTGMIPCFGIREANAQSFRYEDAFSVTWPADLERSECVPFLKSHSVKDGCFQVGERGELGVVFVTVHPGYALGSEDLLERHLQYSEGTCHAVPGFED